MSAEQELLQLAQLDIGLSVALETSEDGPAMASLRAKQEVIQARMRSLQGEISRRPRNPSSVSEAETR
jgi:hypothetical protein